MVNKRFPWSLFCSQSAAAQLSWFGPEGSEVTAELRRCQRDSQLLSGPESCCNRSLLYRQSDLVSQTSLQVLIIRLTWCSVWGVSLSHPQPPLSILKMLFKYLTVQDKAALQHLSSHQYCRPLKCFSINSTGMEVASYLSDKAASVAVVGTTRCPYERSLGPEIGKMSMQVRNHSHCHCWMWFLFDFIQWNTL